MLLSLASSPPRSPLAPGLRRGRGDWPAAPAPAALGGGFAWPPRSFGYFWRTQQCGSALEIQPPCPVAAVKALGRSRVGPSLERQHMGGRKTPRSGEQVSTAQYLSRDQIEVCFGLCCAAPQPEVDSIGVSQVSPADGGFERLIARPRKWRVVLRVSYHGHRMLVCWWNHGLQHRLLLNCIAAIANNPQRHRRHRLLSTTSHGVIF